MSRFLLPAAGVAAALACSSAAVAEDKTLDPMLVTATRTPVAQRDALLPVIVIGRAEIERSLATDVADLLRLHAGLDVARNGGPGQTTSVFIRGAESNHALVLVDGVEINPGTIGGAALQNLSVQAIERIEIVKGPRSSLYGSQAIGGVINFITRAARPGSTVSASATAGRYSTRDVAANASYRGQLAEFGMTAERFETDGFPAQRGSSIDRGWENTTLNLYGGTHLAGAQLAARHWQSTGTSEYLDFFQAPLSQDYANQSTSLELSHSPTAMWQSQLRASYVVDDIEQHESPDFAETLRTALDWQNTVTLGSRNDLVAGVYLSHENVSALSFGAGFSESTDVNALYVADHASWDRAALFVAARYTDHETFGGNASWNTEFGFDATDATRITFGAGTAFRAPDSSDRFGFGGNPNLDPETSLNVEVGMSHVIGERQQIGFSAYRNDIDDLIEFDFDPITFGGGNINVGRARITGIEGRYDWHGDLWDVRAAATLQDPVNRENGEQLGRRAKRSLSFALARRIGDHEIGIDALATGKRRDSSFSDTINAGYVLVGLNGRVRLADRWSLRAKIDNVLDADYETAAGFNTPGRGAYLGLAYSQR